MQLPGITSERLWWYVFGGALVTALVAETFRPFRRLSTPTLHRWLGNWTLIAVSSGLTACVYGLSGIALAVSVQANRYGVLNRLPISPGFRLVGGILALDLCQYVVHRLLHLFGFLWRVHQVHHSESDLDATTGLRFHPGEALLTQAGLLTVIGVLGVPPSAVLATALLALIQDFFTHANVALPQRVDEYLRLVIITPGLHRTHHSDRISEQNTNYGTIFSIWDRLFGTFKGKSANSSFGLRECANGSRLSPARLLLMPFRAPEGDLSEPENISVLPASVPFEG